MLYLVAVLAVAVIILGATVAYLLRRLSRFYRY